MSQTALQGMVMMVVLEEVGEMVYGGQTKDNPVVGHGILCNMLDEHTLQNPIFLGAIRCSFQLYVKN